MLAACSSASLFVFHRDRSKWAKERLQDLFSHATLDDDDFIKLGKEFDHFDGTVLLFNRKGKSGIVYNIEIRCGPEPAPLRP